MRYRGLKRNAHRLIVTCALASLFTARRLWTWGAALFALSWVIHAHTMATPGLVDRVGRFKGSDYVQFYVMGSLVRDGRIRDLYDPQAHLAQARSRIDPALGLYAPRPNYGPQVALAFALLAGLPYAWSLGLFLSISARSIESPSPFNARLNAAIASSTRPIFSRTSP